MKLATLLAVAAIAAAPVLGAPAETSVELVARGSPPADSNAERRVPHAGTNAERMARGLPPLPPARRATPVGAKRSTPSSTPPPTCSTGPVQCCNVVGTIANSLIGSIVGLLGIHVDAGVLVGLTCAPFSITPSCITQPVCCQNNSFNGLIAVGCIAVNL